MSRTRLALGFIVGLAACNPYGADGFSCESDQDCGSNGRCEPLTGFCSFPDESCGEGGRRYGEHAGPRSNDCANPDIQPIIDAPPAPDAPPTCEAGVRECFGNAIETCKANGLGFDPNLRVGCALACDGPAGTPQCLAASNLSISDQLGCGTGTDGALDLQAPSGAVVTIGASSITCTGCNGGVTTIPARGTTPNVWYCLKTFTLANGARLEAGNVGPVTLFVAGQTELNANVDFEGGDGGNANILTVSGGDGGGPGAFGGAGSNDGNAGQPGGGPCRGGGGAVDGAGAAAVGAGGGGAGAAGNGGKGGDANGPLTATAAGGVGGQSSNQCDSQSFAALFGGSGGGSGGDGGCGQGIACGGGGGGGGGAIHIATRATLGGAGAIDASGGSGGDSLDTKGSGGGGGAGGMLFLEAPIVTLSGELDVRGGNGGDVSIRNGGNGANGDLDGSPGQNGPADSTGGTGGGGAAGRIRINAVSGASCGNARPQTACATGPLRLQ